MIKNSHFQESGLTHFDLTDKWGKPVFVLINKDIFN
jgi:hypothetical protein